MLLLRTSKLPEGQNWSYELKLEGYRALAIRTNGHGGGNCCSETVKPSSLSERCSH